MQDIYTKIREFLNNKYHIPLLQRNYAWDSGSNAWENDGSIKPGQRNTAHNLIYEIIDNFEVKREMILGLVTIYSNDNKIQIIDGQQRMITLTLILKALDGKYNGELIFERDYEEKNVRYNFLYNSKENLDAKIISVDVQRMDRNLKEIKKVLEYYGYSEKKQELIDYIFDFVKIIKYETKTEPLDEFLNINSYKTPFSIVDYLRGQVLRDIENTNKDTKQELFLRLKKLSNLLYNDDKNSLYQELGFGYNIKDGERNRLDIFFIDRYSENNIVDYGNIERTYHNTYHCNEKFSELKILELYHKLLEELSLQWDCGLNQIKDMLNCFIDNKKYFSIYNFSKNNEYPLKDNEIKNIEDYPHISELLYNKAKEDNRRNYYAQIFFTKPLLKEYNTTLTENSSEYSIEFSELEKSLKSYSSKMKEVSKDLGKLKNINIYDETLQNTHKEKSEKKINEVMTLEELFNSKYIDSIKIPKLQRDYIQGSSPEKFIKAISDTYDQKLEHFTANCIIGYIDENKTLWIYDGQQRITTFICIMAKLLKNEQNETNEIEKWQKLLNKFSFDYREEANNALKNIIMDQGSEIKICDLTTYSLKQIWNKLTEGNILKSFCNETVSEFAKFIKFQFISIEYRSEAEQLFMDLNSGQPLTQEDIYKSKLIAQLKQLDETNDNEILISKSKIKQTIMKLDNEWLDKYGNEKKEFDKLQFYFHCAYNERYHDNLLLKEKEIIGKTNPVEILNWFDKNHITEGFMETIFNIIDIENIEHEPQNYAQWVEFRKNMAEKYGIQFSNIMEIEKNQDRVYFSFTKEGIDNPFFDKLFNDSIIAIKLAYDMYYIDNKKIENKLEAEVFYDEFSKKNKIAKIYNYDCTGSCVSNIKGLTELTDKLNERLNIKEFYDNKIWESTLIEFAQKELRLDLKF